MCQSEKQKMGELRYFAIHEVWMASGFWEEPVNKISQNWQSLK
jgi:hypothetical protein